MKIQNEYFIVNNPHRDIYKSFVKPFFDRLLSLLVLILFSPIVLFGCTGNQSRYKGSGFLCLGKAWSLWEGIQDIQVPFDDR